MKFHLANKILYTVFSLLGVLVIVIGVIMRGSNFKSSYRHGPTYEATKITGTEVMWLGAGLLATVFIIYLLKERRRQ